MKSLKSVIIALVFSVALMSCNEEGIDIPNTNDAKSFIASADLSKSDGSALGTLDGTPVLQFSISGSGYSSVLGDFVIQGNHTETFGSNLETYEIGNGEFVLRTTLGDELFGYYVGQGDVYEGHQIISERFQITGGSGKYLNAGGSMSVNISGSVSDIMKAQIRGKVFLNNSGTTL